MKICGREVLGHILDRLAACDIDETVVATSDHPENDAVEAFVKDNGYAVFRGDEQDVLGRFYQCAALHKADVIIRVTADNPLCDPEIINSCIHGFDNDKTDYLRTAPGLPLGLGVEIVSYKALEACHLCADQPRDREHVTTYIYSTAPDRFQIYEFQHGLDLSQYRWTIDTERDFELVEDIYKALYPENLFGYREILRAYDANPQWLGINDDIAQKPY